MKVKDLIVGNKYVPHRKSERGFEGLESSVVWGRANDKNQPYLYYTGQDENGRYCFDSEFIENKITGDFFNPSDVEPYEEFVLPEKWCIKIYSENESVLKEYWLNQPYEHEFGFQGYLLSECSWDNSGLNYASNIRIATSNKYTEITFEQFKTYVLKSKVMDKKLIGYNLKSEFKSMEDAASYIAFQNRGWTINIPQFVVGERDTEIDRFRRAGVLDLWFDKVYEDEKKEETYHLGDKAVTITFRKEGIFADGRKFDIKPFKELIHITDINGYSLTINEFKIGCTTVRREEVADLLIKADRFYKK